MKSTIRLATKEDIPSIMKFINTYWKKGHILATDRKLFDWQYINYDKVNFVIGCNIDNEIQGILGFVPYDKSDEKDIALALWKAEHTNSSILGIEMLVYLLQEEAHTTIFCTGINPKTTYTVYQYLGMTVGTMLHWYRLGKPEKYYIADIVDNTIPMIDQVDEYSLKLYHDVVELEKDFDFEEYSEKGKRPIKSKSYIQKRYFEHPVYDYKVFGVINQNNKAKTIIVLRIQEYSDAKVIRFVDCIGESTCLPFITTDIDDLLQEYKAEYIDMYEVGLSEEMMLSAGWLRVKNSGNIIPNFFSPFERCNVDIHYCSSDPKVILFRGDGDQDRPN